MANTPRRETRTRLAKDWAASVVSPSSRASAARPKPSARANRRDGSGWSRWLPVLVAAVVVVAGLAAWWVFPALGRGGDVDGPQPIATLDAPDVHSLLVDPASPDHVLFGSHAGIQESRDGGFSWEAGELRGADAMSLAASPKAAETFYAAGHDVFRVSRDGGASWQPVEHDLPGTDIHAFAQDPNDPLRLYALVAGTGVLASGDGGTTWTPLPSQPPGGGMHIALASGGEGLYAATEAGVVVNRDQGTTWERLPAQPGGAVLSLAIPADAPQILYAGTDDGLARSTDGGASWTTPGPKGTPALALAAAPADPNRVLLVDENGAVYRSDDGGASWLAPR